MTRDQIHTQLKNSNLSSHEREQLHQLLHYMTVEGITNTSSNSNIKHTTSSKPSSKHRKRK